MVTFCFSLPLSGQFQLGSPKSEFSSLDRFFPIFLSSELLSQKTLTAGDSARVIYPSPKNKSPF